MKAISHYYSVTNSWSGLETKSVMGEKVVVLLFKELLRDEAVRREMSHKTRPDGLFRVHLAAKLSHAKLCYVKQSFTKIKESTRLVIGLGTTTPFPLNCSSSCARKVRCVMSLL